MKTKVTQDQIDNLFMQSEKSVCTFFDNCLVMVCRLPNGFTIVEHSVCVDPANYDPEIGYKICEEKIKNKLSELERYKMHSVFCDANTK